MQDHDYLESDIEDQGGDPEKGLLNELKQKKRKNRTKEINVMNKKKLSRYELDDYMMNESIESDFDESDF